MRDVNISWEEHAARCRCVHESKTMLVCVDAPTSECDVAYHERQIGSTEHEAKVMEPIRLVPGDFNLELCWQDSCDEFNELYGPHCWQGRSTVLDKYGGDDYVEM